MKKIFFFFLFAVISYTVFAQSASEHLTFKGVPINGTLNEFVSKLKQKGLAHIGTEEGIAMLKGDFAAYKNCTIAAVSLKQKNLVAKVGVIFPSLETWSSLSNNYFSLKEMLTKKYGEPAVCVEEFQNDFGKDNDNLKIHGVKMDKCKYVTGYATAKGNIELHIKGDVMNGCYVTLIYFDKINGEIIEAEAMDDLYIKNYSIKYKKSRKQVHLQMCSTAAFLCRYIISSCKRVAALILPVARIVLHISFLNNLCLF